MFSHGNPYSMETKSLSITFTAIYSALRIMCNEKKELNKYLRNK